MSELKPCRWCGAVAPCFDNACPLKNAVPDVPELVRYDLDYGGIVPDIKGRYVRHDQAAEIVEEARLQKKAWADKWDHAISRAEAAEAELAQINDQKPVGENCVISLQKHLSDAGYKIPLKHIDDAIAKHYAAPVASESEDATATPLDQLARLDRDLI